MSRWSSVLTLLAGAALVAGSSWISACGGAQPVTLRGTGSSGGNTSSGGTSGGSSGGTSGGSSGANAGSSGSSSGGNQSSGSGSGNGSGSSSGNGTSSGGDAGVPCPPGLMCDVPCSGSATTLSGKVYDPAGKNPLYDVVVYVPATPLSPLPAGVPTGADQCSCAALYKSGAIASAVTGVDGSFTLTNVPVGASVPLVLQVGKWRRSLSVPVMACQDNPQTDKSLTLPSTVAPGSDDNMPDIAVSTGSADTLECLLERIGLPSSEYVPGAGGGGHIHVFSGGDPSMNDNYGTPEVPAMMGAPQSNLSLWDSADHLMPYDITLLSCEGAETYAANPAALETYLNAGGRVFASHYHYAWFSGSIDSNQGYTAPADWGSNLASWMPDPNSLMGPIGGILDTALNGSSQPFPKGQALQQWLAGVGALGVNAPAGELSIFDPRYNAAVTTSNGPSQPWITSDSSGMAGQTMYFTFNTPIATPTPGTGQQYCGRAVYSDLHVGADPATTDDPNMPPPAKCANVDLSPQEKALEFMLFDLSACVIPDSVAPAPMFP